MPEGADEGEVTSDSSDPVATVTLGASRPQVSRMATLPVEEPYAKRAS